MIHIRPEGELTRNGFNFYPLIDAGSFGFVFRYGAKRFTFRYSKITKKWIIG